MNAVTQKVRESNFELLRILAMFLIVLHHCVIHGIFDYWHNNISTLDHINNFFAVLTASGGQVGVALFVLLCGYFSCQQKFRLSKWFSIYLRMLFMSLLIFGVWIFVNNQQASMWVDTSLFPLTHNAYWFVCAYLVLYGFMPLLNTVLQKTPEKTMQKYLIWATFVLIVFPFFGLGIAFSPVLYFMYLYVLGGSIKLNYISLKCKFFTWFFIVTILTTWFCIFRRIFMMDEAINLRAFYSYYTGLNSIYVLAASLLLFKWFSKLKINSQWINWGATSMFGIYLLHDNVLVKPYLWNVWLGVYRTMTTQLFVWWVLFVSACVFCACFVLDKVLSVFYIPFIEVIMELGEKVYKKINAKRLKEFLK